MLGETNDVRPTDRRAARREATKAEILDAAWELVREQGLAALSLRDLAERVGMRAPSLYQYFDSKHAIYDAMFADGYRQALVEIPPQPAADGAHDRNTFVENALAFFDFCTSDPARYQLLFQRTIPGFEPSPESYAPSVELLERTRRAFVDMGFDEADLDLWTALMSGLTDQQISNDPGGDRWRRRVPEAVDMFFDHVRTTKETKS